MSTTQRAKIALQAGATYTEYAQFEYDKGRGFVTPSGWQVVAGNYYKNEVITLQHHLEAIRNLVDMEDCPYFDNGMQSLFRTEARMLSNEEPKYNSAVTLL